MNKFGEAIAKHRKMVLLIATLLLLPSLYGMAMTKINYDILTYLPEELESVIGQEILNEEFNSSASGMLIIEDTPPKEIVKLKEKIKGVDGVKSVTWVDDIMDISVPEEMLPEPLQNLFYGENSTLVLIGFEEDSSSLVTQKAIGDVRELLNNTSYLSGMAAVLKDTRDLAGGQTTIYILLAVSLATLVLVLTLESTIVPFLILTSIGYAVLYNMGTNIMFGQISYITKSLAAVLQLGVTMDYSIFLIHRYEEESRNESNNVDAMGKAIALTASSIVGSSLTTVAGFLAIAVMELTIGKDIGFVMAKGVVFGVLSVLTILPSLILVFDKAVKRFHHGTILPEFNHLAKLVTKHYKVFIIIGLVILAPAYYGDKNNDVYYNMDESLPDDMESIVALRKLKDDYNMMTTHMIVLSKDTKNYEITQMIKEIEKVDGVESALSYQKIVGPTIPESFLPSALTDKFESEGHKQIIINSGFKSATDEQNNQIDEIDKIVKSYDPNGMITGEGALTKDLIAIADRDFARVNTISNIAVFAIILLVFKSVSIPVLLIVIIRLAILINMSVPFYTGRSIPFISSIVIGSIQLGATVDYAILMTTRFREEINNGLQKFEAMEITVKESAKSIVTSGFAFFASTVGVAIVSDIEITKSLSGMIAKGALISTVVILLILPGILLASETIVSMTSMGWKKHGKERKESVAYDNK